MPRGSPSRFRAISITDAVSSVSVNCEPRAPMPSVKNVMSAVRDAMPSSRSGRVSVSIISMIPKFPSRFRAQSVSVRVCVWRRSSRKAP